MARLHTLKAKLHPPRLGRDIVFRPRLQGRLDKQLPLTLVVAPAGYGKTTVVSSWLQQQEEAGAWLAVDAYDDSLSAFMTSVLSAVQSRFPGVCAETTALLNSVASPPASEVAARFSDELQELPRPLVLVLDDYHAISDLSVHQVIAELLTYQPAMLRLVIISRYDPPLPIASLRAHNRVAEIRASDLRFSREESDRFLRATTDVGLSDELNASLHQLTEGWVTGLHLAALLVDQQGGDAELGGSGSGLFAMEFLATEVLSHLPADIQNFLLRTWILDQMCAPLCAAVLADGSTAEQCQRILSELTDRNLFVFALHGPERWYRYHQLFAMMLQHRAAESMPPAAIAALHARASAWLEERGQIKEALSHAIRSGDVAEVAGVVRRQRQPLMAAEDWTGLETWRRLIPSAMVEQHPQLLMLTAWAHQRAANIPEAAACLRRMALLMQRIPLPPEEEALLRCEMGAIEALAHYWTGQLESALAAAARCLSADALRGSYPRTIAWMILIVVTDMFGRHDEANLGFAESLSEGNEFPGTAFVGRSALVGGYLHTNRADMHALDDLASGTVGLAAEHSWLEALSWGRHWRGFVNYQRNDLDSAANDFAAVLNMSYLGHPNAFTQSVIGLAATYQARGEFAKAHETIESLVRRLRESYQPNLLERAEAFLAELDFRQGRNAEAMRWAARHNAGREPGPEPFFHSRELARPLILLGQGTPEDRAAADELLERMRSTYEGHHNVMRLITVYALQGYSAAQQGREDAGLALVQRAVELAAPLGCVRALADLAFLIGPLLGQLAHDERLRGPIARIRRAAVAGVGSPVHPASTPETAGASDAEASGASPLAGARPLTAGEVLTHREMDVLRLLLDDRPSNKEIAAALNVTDDTVKRHLVAIYRKLHVSNRRQAIARAQELGISPHR